MGGYATEVVTGARNGFGAWLLRAMLTAPAVGYAAGLKLYLFTYRAGIRKQTHLPKPVISVGNITSGGTGKTPLVEWICSSLVERDIRPAVLSRGYRGEFEHASAVVSTPERVELTARQAGDEAYLLAMLLPGTPVIVGKDRRRTGALAIERFQPDILVLDDGMQFYQLYRDLDIAAVNARDPFHNGWTLPRGLLREPPSHLRRAQCIVITNADAVSQGALQGLMQRLAKLAPSSEVFTARSVPSALVALDHSAAPPLTWLRGRRVATLCALGHPQTFEEQVRSLGADIVHSCRLPDHEAPTMARLEQFITQGRAHEAEAVIVSLKDAVKLPPISRPLRFYALKVTLEVEDGAKLLKRIFAAARLPSGGVPE
ncbi:MAG: tetraacyldisaccharide 4'-kinase [Chthonomonadales bacterium]